MPQSCWVHNDITRALAHNKNPDRRIQWNYRETSTGCYLNGLRDTSSCAGVRVDAALLVIRRGGNHSNDGIIIPAVKRLMF